MQQQQKEIGGTPKSIDRRPAPKQGGKEEGKLKQALKTQKSKRNAPTCPQGSEEAQKKKRSLGESVFLKKSQGSKRGQYAKNQSDI